MGERRRTVRRFDYEGGRYAEIEYLGGETDGLWSVYRAPGRLEWQRQMRSGRAHGWSRAWNDRGVLVEESHFHSGVPHGPWLSWFDDGRPKRERAFRSGHLHGRAREWDDAGNVVSECQYDLGRVIAVADCLSPPQAARPPAGLWHRLEPYLRMDPEVTGPPLESLDRLATACVPIAADRSAPFEDVFLLNSLGWINAVGDSESWPGRNGVPMAPVLQLRMDALGPSVPEALRDVALLAVYADTAEDRGNAAGTGLLVRAYPELGSLRPVRPPGPLVTEPALLACGPPRDDYPDIEDTPLVVRILLDELPEEERAARFPNCGTSKIGGWPHCLQHRAVLPEDDFVLQVDTIELDWSCGDAAIWHVYRRARGSSWSALLQSC